MRSQVFLVCSLVLPLALPGQSSDSRPWRPAIPKSWDAEELEAWTIRPRNPGVYTVHLPPSFVYSIPPYPIYKTYPIYGPAKEPKGYMEWLSRQEPEFTFDAAKLRTEADWIAAGRLVFEAPQDFQPAENFRDPAWYEKLRVPLTSEGIVPGRRYVIRKKGVVEAAAGACVACHSRVMPDGTLLNGAQSNFPYERDVAWRMRKQGDIESARGLLFGLHFPSWSRAADYRGRRQVHAEPTAATRGTFALPYRKINSAAASEIARYSQRSEKWCSLEEPARYVHQPPQPGNVIRAANLQKNHGNCEAARHPSPMLRDPAASCQRETDPGRNHEDRSESGGSDQKSQGRHAEPELYCFDRDPQRHAEHDAGYVEPPGNAVQFGMRPAQAR